MQQGVQGRQRSLLTRLGRRSSALVAGVLALGLIAAACGGDDGDVSSPTAPPADTAAAAPSTPTATSEPAEPAEPAATGEPLQAFFTVSAQNVAFDTAALTLQSGTEVTINFVNDDDSIPHNLRISGPGGFEVKTDIFTGNDGRSRKLVFTAPAPGSYAFECEVHPATMNGTVTVQ
jgi:plastocyanin